MPSRVDCASCRGVWNQDRGYCVERQRDRSPQCGTVSQCTGLDLGDRKFAFSKLLVDEVDHYGMAADFAAEQDQSGIQNQGEVDHDVGRNLRALADYFDV